MILLLKGEGTGSFNNRYLYQIEQLGVKENIAVMHVSSVFLMFLP